MWLKIKFFLVFLVYSQVYVLYYLFICPIKEEWEGKHFTKLNKLLIYNQYIF